MPSPTPHPSSAPTHNFRRRGVAVWLLAALPSACGPAPKATWTGGIATIVHRHCSGCHRPGEPTPFSLLDYEDAADRRRQIARVTSRRLMPPWLPSHGDFVDDRSLDDASLAQLQQWCDSGAPHGPGDAPAPPRFTDGWQLGPPDLVIEAPEPIDLPADGPDRFCNLVLPAKTEVMRHVEAVEIRPGSPAVHHAVLQVDGTRDSRMRDALDEAPGFPGMSMGLSRAPDGHFLGWTPGKVVHRQPPGFAWRLWPGNDLVLQLHLTPTGRAERIQPRIGLWFTDTPATVHPFALVMRDEAIDIPAGVEDYVARDHFELPVAVDLHAIYPHAHYLCANMQAWATPPDGTRQLLFAIDRWDFDWQDDYRYREPLHLGAGTLLQFEYRYDNSESNPANPHTPPRRVRYGLESSDEMATLTLTLLAANPAQRDALPVAAASRDVQRAPDDVNSWLNLSIAFRDAGDLPRAERAAAEALSRSPGAASALRELGICRMMRGDLQSAEPDLRTALASNPDDSIARMHLGELLARSGRTRQAIEQFDLAVAIHPNHAILHNNLATALFIDGQLERAAMHYGQATRIDPTYFNAWLNLGRVLAQLGQRDRAHAALIQADGIRLGDPAVMEALQELDR